MKVQVLLNRALSALGKKSVYKSPGQMPSFAADSWPVNSKTDCSGFVAWCLRFAENRKVDHPLYKKTNGGWFETTTIHADGMASTGFFSQIKEAKPGALLVYPDYKDANGKWRQGHVGIITEVSGKKISDVKKIIHCSVSNSTQGDAIQETAPAAWIKNKESIIVWFDGITF